MTVAPQCPAGLRARLSTPEFFFSPQGKVILNNHRSQVHLADDYFFKKCKLRRPAHLARDFFRRSAARTSFQMSLDLVHAGIPTAAPFAVAEYRRGGFLLASYLVMEKIQNAVNLHDYLASAGEEEPAILVELARLVARFHKAGFSWNRDLNDRNILVDASGGLHLVDLDGMRRQRRSPDTLWRKELRFLAASLMEHPNLSDQVWEMFVTEYSRIQEWKAIQPGVFSEAAIDKSYFGRISRNWPHWVSSGGSWLTFLHFAILEG